MFAICSYPHLRKKNLKFQYRNQYQQLTDDLVRLLPKTECLNAHWFMSLEDAREKMEAWRRDYNEVRPHSAIGNKPPIELINRDGASGPPS
jgi:transposase InsO family protein